MTCRRTVNPKMLLPRRRLKVVPIGTMDLLVQEGGTEFKSKKSWLNWLKKIIVG